MKDFIEYLSDPSSKIKEAFKNKINNKIFKKQALAEFEVEILKEFIEKEYKDLCENEIKLERTALIPEFRFSENDSKDTTIKLIIGIICLILSILSYL